MNMNQMPNKSKPKPKPKPTVKQKTTIKPKAKPLTPAQKRAAKIRENNRRAMMEGTYNVWS